MPANQRNYDGEPFRSICTHDAHYAYPIPYRCFYSRNVPNLFMAGRDISVTHVALGTTRVMRTHGMMGEVVGMAAFLCRKYGCDPRGVYTDHLDELKSLMTKGVGQGKPQPPQDYNLGALKKTTYGWDAQSLTRNGKPWVPVMGEMHYSRVPKAEWCDYVRKMKAGGVDIVASYVFWNHHEPAYGEFDFTDSRDLGAFVRLCAEEGMLVCLRLGPWAHGEAREGGLPDWLFDAAKYGRIRTDDPKFLAAVERFWRALYAQVDGSLCKQGGPIIAVQLENESPGPWPYFAALKALAKKVGFDVPYYTRTGWPKFDGEPVYGEILPLFGGYADGFWSRSNEMSPGAYRDAFRFSATRTSTTIATDFFGTEQSDKDAADVKRYPYLTCELGGGMVSSYQRRLQTFPMDAFAMAVQRLGSGSNLLGYYMYAGGTNPSDPAKGVFANESTSGRYTNHNDLPVFSYEFNAPISEFGELNPHYRMLKAVHDFCHQYGPEFAMIAPDIRSDVESRRGRFVFHNDYVRGQRPDGNAWIGIDENGAIRRLVDGRALLAEAEREIAARPPAVPVGFRLVKPAGPARTIPERGKGFPAAPTEADWEQAAVYAIETPAGRGLLVVDYLGDCARLYVDDVPVADDFYKGLPFKAGLWRYPAGKLTVRILPWTDSPLIYVQAPFRPKERGAAVRKVQFRHMPASLRTSSLHPSAP